MNKKPVSSAELAKALADKLRRLLGQVEWLPASGVLCCESLSNISHLRPTIPTGDTKQGTEILQSVPSNGVWLYWSWPPLHGAVKRGQKDVAKCILKTGADLNATSDLHQTPVDLAVKLDHGQLVTSTPTIIYFPICPRVTPS